MSRLSDEPEKDSGQLGRYNFDGESNSYSAIRTPHWYTSLGYLDLAAEISHADA